MDTLKYPVGTFRKPDKITAEIRSKWIQTIKDFPGEIRQLTQSLSKNQLQLKYRPGGWTICQVVHHCADSHLNSYTRFKLALTEDEPTIRPYFEDRWAELPDAKDTDITASLQIIEGLHKRWAVFLQNLTEADFKRTFYHPEAEKTYDLNETTGLYAWHCRHHLAHIKLALNPK